MLGLRLERYIALACISARRSIKLQQCKISSTATTAVFAFNHLIMCKKSLSNTILARFPFPISFLSWSFASLCAAWVCPITITVGDVSELNIAFCWLCKATGERWRRREEGKNGRDCVTLLFFLAWFFSFFFLLLTPRRISCLRYILTAGASSSRGLWIVKYRSKSELRAIWVRDWMFFYDLTLTLQVRLEISTECSNQTLAISIKITCSKQQTSTHLQVAPDHLNNNLKISLLWNRTLLAMPLKPRRFQNVAKLRLSTVKRSLEKKVVKREEIVTNINYCANCAALGSVPLASASKRFLIASKNSSSQFVVARCTKKNFFLGLTAREERTHSIEWRIIWKCARSPWKKCTLISLQSFACSSWRIWKMAAEYVQWNLTARSGNMFLWNNK